MVRWPYTRNHYGRKREKGRGGSEKEKERLVIVESRDYFRERRDNFSG